MLGHYHPGAVYDAKFEGRTGMVLAVKITVFNAFCLGAYPDLTWTVNVCWIVFVHGLAALACFGFEKVAFRAYYTACAKIHGVVR